MVHNPAHDEVEVPFVVLVNVCRVRVHHAFVFPQEVYDKVVIFVVTCENFDVIALNLNESSLLVQDSVSNELAGHFTKYTLILEMGVLHELVNGDFSVLSEFLKPFGEIRVKIFDLFNLLIAVGRRLLLMRLLL